MWSRFASTFAGLCQLSHFQELDGLFENSIQAVVRSTQFAERDGDRSFVHCGTVKRRPGSNSPPPFPARPIAQGNYSNAVCIRMFHALASPVGSPEAKKRRPVFPGSPQWALVVAGRFKMLADDQFEHNTELTTSQLTNLPP
ncbi:hypothetical protein N658DRAFT_140250 [Parathielavia hyrcaniae]|uniref:Uncharacterized protein n=1 Tax=Parathielavia hyrcaniae TaxID=113614 RepID=A0AAN6T0D2_9PEZI|nr:hypothetical protein N658DRAFT_140250 [Parathielavia hyrcaniae]